MTKYGTNEAITEEAINTGIRRANPANVPPSNHRPIAGGPTPGSQGQVGSSAVRCDMWVCVVFDDSVSVWG